MSDREEYDMRKKAIFDSMSRRGQERILKIGYENWEPFDEPKDPRERIFGGASMKASELIRRFYESTGGKEESVSDKRDLFELCRGLLQGESRAKAIYDFCNWYRNNAERN